MADTVLSVRIDEELKQRFIELAQETGVNNKDLMQLLVAQFELNQMGGESQQFQQEVEELQQITKRMTDIYIHLMERQKIRELALKNKENQQLIKQEEEIEKLKESLEQLSEKEKVIQQLKDEVKGLKQTVTTYKEEERNFKDLNDLLRQKNTELEREAAQTKVILDSAKATREEVAKLKAEVADQMEEIKRLTTQLELKRNEIKAQEERQQALLVKEREALNQHLEIVKKEQALNYQELNLQLKADYLKEIEQLKKEEEAKRALLQAEYQKKLEKMRNLTEEESWD